MSYDGEYDRSEYPDGINAPRLGWRGSREMAAKDAEIERLRALVDDRQPEKDAFYRAFLAEIDAVRLTADMGAAAVLGECTRAAKRAQMVLDGELPKVGER
jgi:hypothetical protein